MWWNRIIEWFANQKERKQIFKEFNQNAKEAFINNLVPIYFKAEQSRGNNAYKHQFSNFFFHGFRIKIFSGRNLMMDEVLCLGALIISNTPLVRRLVTAGFDTIEITDIYGNVVQDWRLTTLLEISNN